MKHGDKDGFNSIYDENGELILHPREKVLINEDNVVPSLKSTWRYYGGDYLLEPSKGSIFLTNERLVFINIPERMFAIGGGDGMRAMSATMESSFDLKDMPPGGVMREYFEIPNIEIMGSEKKEGAVSMGMMVNMYVLSSGNQFHLSMVLNSDSELLSRLMNKRVSNLDELVNNLKDFFQKTDWMYTEPEKKLYHDLIMEEKEAMMTPKPSEEEEVVEEKLEAPRTVVRPNPVKIKKTQPKVKPLEKPREKLKSNSMKYFQNLFNKGLITDEIYGRLVKQYGNPDNSSSQPAKKTYARPEPVEALPGPEPIPTAQTYAAEENPMDQVQEVVEAPPEEPDSGMKDEDLLGIISDTIADVESAQQMPEEGVQQITDMGSTQPIPDAGVQQPVEGGSTQQTPDEGVQAPPPKARKVSAKKRKTLTIKD